MIVGAGLSVSAQQRAYRVSDRQMEQLLRRIDTRSTLFRQNLDVALDRSRFDNTRREDNINELVREYDLAAARLRERFNQRQDTIYDAREVLDRAARIDRFMRRQTMTPAAERNWAALRADLDTLANYYNVGWRWDNGDDRPVPPRQNAASRLTGTYRLDNARSDDPTAVAERATRGLPLNQAQRLRRIIMRRLASPEMIAIDRNGRSVTMASSLAPQVAFEADGRDRIEQIRQGRNVRVNTALYGDQLVISTVGDRGNDFRFSFDPIENGQRLRVTRSVSIEGLGQPVSVNSVYDKVSDSAQLDIYRETRGSYIPNEMQLVATLNERLSTRESREGDRFTMTVNEPPQYRGAIIDGYISKIDRGGRLTGRAEMAFNFERIRLRNGASYDFEGYIESVRTPDGEEIRVDNEGVISERNAQTSRTVTRTGIGAAVGALLGAIVGGGKGAAIGAAIGAGTGAGSVFVQGRDDLELMSGSRITIHALVPRNRAS
jgi:hypothetical protein